MEERNANRFINKRVSFLFFMLSICTMIFSTTACLDASKCPMFAKADTDHQKYVGTIGHGMVFEDKTRISIDWARKFLRGPGSSPPLCTSKCGSCTPCRPVHVTVPPGTPVTAEYYPEAWRCKCGNKLSMP
ncbi:EPIDERMAL PATTERNING FACTOR-like protein 6 [Cajanus cajan]|nr:EPIDERMAL PATTERNING FACTOR-like protein 6 [Cajanus cajan]